METSTMLESILLTHTKVAALRDDEEGQALLEYALILSLVALVCVAALTLLGTNVSNLLNSAAAAF
jgi:pilus assembly protein Flp/PilA